MHFECEYTCENAKTEMGMYVSNFRTLHMQFWQTACSSFRWYHHLHFSSSLQLKG